MNGRSDNSFFEEMVGDHLEFSEADNDLDNLVEAPFSQNNTVEQLTSEVKEQELTSAPVSEEPQLSNYAKEANKIRFLNTRFGHTRNLNTHKRLFGSLRTSVRTNHTDFTRQFDEKKRQNFEKCQLAKFNKSTPRKKEADESLAIDPPEIVTVRDSVQDILDNMDNFTVPSRPVSRTNHYHGEKFSGYVNCPSPNEATANKPKSSLKRPAHLIKFKPSTIQEGLFGTLSKTPTTTALQFKGSPSLLSDVTRHELGPVHNEPREKAVKARSAKGRTCSQRPPSRKGIPSQVQKASEADEALFQGHCQQQEQKTWRAPWNLDKTPRPHIFSAVDYKAPPRPTSTTQAKPAWK